MAESDDPKAEDSAEKAYAAAAEAVGGKGESDASGSAPIEPEAEPVEFPAKPKRARKAEPKPEEPAITPEVLDVAPPVDEPAPKPRRVRAVTVKSKPTAKRAAAKPAVTKAAPAKLRKPSVQKTKTAPKAASKKTVPAGSAAAPKIPLLAQLKEIPMDMSTSIKDAVSGAQEKAKEAYTKGSAAAAEYGEFAKGNVEACVESGKILAAGLQEMGKKFVEDGKTAFETASADVKAMTSVKSPTDLFKLQTELLRRNFDTAVSYSTKNAEAMVKLTSDAFAPISARVNLAVEKLKKAA